MITGCVNDITVQGLICNGDVPKSYVDASLNLRVLKSGDTMSGKLTVNASTHFGSATDYVQIDASGDLKLMGAASQWIDIRFPATTVRRGVTSKPDFDYANVGLLFPQNDETEKIYLLAQLNHDRKDGTNLSPHIHYIQDETTAPTFKMEYRWYENGGTLPSWTTIESSTLIFPYSGSPIMQLLEFPDINGAAINSVSSMLDIIVYRKTGDGLTGDVLVKEFDIHVEVDAFGSNTEYLK